MHPCSSVPAITDVNLTPKTVGAMTSFSRRTLINAVPSIEQLVRRDLAATIASAIDYQALMGDGTGNTPTGIANTSGVAAPSLAGPTWAQVLGVIASIQNEDADLGNLGWALNPAAVALLRGTVKATGEGAGFLMDHPMGSGHNQTRLGLSNVKTTYIQRRDGVRWISAQTF